MPDFLAPTIFNEQFPYQIVFETPSLGVPLTILHGDTYSLPTIDTEFGRTGPTPKDPPDTGGGPGSVEVIAIPSKSFAVWGWTNSIANYWLRFNIYERTSATSTRQLRKVIDKMFPNFEFEYTAINTIVEIEVVNVNAAFDISDGEIKILSR